MDVAEAFGAGVTRTLAEYIADAGEASLPDGVVAATKLALLDHLACAVGGATLPPARIAAGMVQRTGGRPRPA
jgi:2-methylcitrate dehydratase PrpD